MTTPKPVRTYLDPDAVGPLPRSALADDSDALASAKTQVLCREGTQELGPDDMLEILDPNRTPDPTSSATRTGPMLARRPRLPASLLASFALGIAAVLAVFAVRAALSPSRAPDAQAPAQPPRVVAAAVPVAPAALPAPAASAETGVLRADGPLVFVDGALAGVTSAVVACGPHDVSVGEPGHPRRIEVPCGGEVTVYR